MATTIKGTGIIASTDFHTVVWTGKTKKGNAISITLNNAINKDNIDLSMVEKDDTVAALTFTAAYANTNAMVATAADYEEPWSITYANGSSDEAADCILLGAGIVSIDGTDIALTRGGSQFTVTREFRNINADGDRGTVNGRVVMDGSEATLTVNALTFLNHITTISPPVTVTTTT